MYHAAICEDEQAIAKYIEKTLSNEFRKNNTQVAFDVFTNGNRLLDMINEHYHFDIIFMDIEMPGIDGISICKKIRAVSSEILVIFISNKDDLVFSTFEVQPFRFIRKSCYDAMLSSLIPAIMIELQRRHPHNVKIVEPRSNDIFSFDVNQITFIEACGKYCRINTTANCTEVKIKLMEIEEQLSDFEFIKVHRSYLVNYKYIAVIKKNGIKLTDSTLIPISRNRIDEVKHIFIQYTNRSL